MRDARHNRKQVGRSREVCHNSKQMGRMRVACHIPADDETSQR